MYKEYWKLKESPFEANPDPKFFYKSSMHEEALIRLLYVVSGTNKGAALLTGEVGSGKTLSCKIFSQMIKNEKTVFFPMPFNSEIEFLKEIFYQLKIEMPSDQKVDLVRRLNEELIHNFQSGKKTIVVMDECQAIQNLQVFDELRLLLNLQYNNQFLLTLIFVGQPELREMIKKIPQLNQRIAVRYHIANLSLQDTINYIVFRLKVAGLTRGIFTREAIELIFEFTTGVPRKVNNICDLCLLTGYGLKSEIINTKIVSKILEEYK